MNTLIIRVRPAAALLLLLLSFPAVALGQDCDLEGTWEVLSVRFTDPDGTVREIQPGDPPGLKILNGTHWIFVEMTGNEEAPVSGGGGRYTVDGNTYTEYVEYHGAESYIGETIPFDCRVEGDLWYQDGMLPGGTMLEEVYRRVK